MKRVILLFLAFFGLMASLSAGTDAELKKQDGAWWIYWYLSKPGGTYLGHGGALIIQYKYTVIATGKVVTQTTEVPDHKGVLIGKANEITEPVILQEQLKRYLTDPAHAK
jgi:hypothetical protein